MPTPVLIDKPSVILGAACALCRQPFAPQDEIIVCPQDGTQHHTYCWEANGNRCSALGCSGRGPIERPSDPPPAPAAPQAVVAARGAAARAGRPRQRDAIPVILDAAPAVPAVPAASADPAPAVVNAPWLQQAGQSCIILAIALAILLFGFSCFGLWAIADYIMLHILEWNYRLPPQNHLFESAPGWLAWAAVWLAA